MGKDVTREQSQEAMARIMMNMPWDRIDSTMLQKKVIGNPKNFCDEIVDMINGKPEQQAVPTEKFAVLIELGVITVPDDYDHKTQLAKFFKKNRKKFYGINDNITDENFQNPTRILKPGDKLRVTAYKQIVSGSTTSEERMKFLRSQNAVFTGAQGPSLVFEQKRDELPKGYWYGSFDEKDRLWKDSDGYLRVPRLGRYSVGVFYFDLGFFEFDWDDDNAFFCFRDVE